MIPDENIYRQIVDILLREREDQGVPDFTGYPTKVATCVWGLYSYIYRLGRATTILIDDGMAFEAIPMIRIMLEHTIVLHWIVERGNEGVDAMIANQAKQMKRWMDNTKDSELALSPTLEAWITESFTGIDETKAIQSFKAVCEQIDAQSLYALYGNLSQFVHPTTTTSNIFVPDTGPSSMPTGDHSANISLVAHCLIWTERAFDRLTPGHPKSAELESLAKSINARPILSPYHPVTPPSRQNKSGKGRRRGGNKRS
jgi:hypothetical protein